MGKTACLILGSIFLLQAPSVLGDISPMSFDEASTSEQPHYREEHARELGGDEAHVTPEAITKFVYKRTQELLPVPFKGRAHRVAQALIQTANDHQMDPLFLMAVINQESKFNPKALGLHGEIGLMQLKPSTALTVANVQGLTDEQALADVSEMLADPVQNIRLGAAYLSRLRVSFRHRSSLYISAYNMGATRVREHVQLGNSPRIYSDKVLAQYNDFNDDASNVIVLARTELHVFNRTLAL